MSILLASMVFAAAPLGAAPPSAGEPVYLTRENVPGALRFQVVGDAATAASGTYSLEIVSGGNRSVQRGRLQLQPGVRTILSTVEIGDGGTSWAARLSVDLGGSSYEIRDASN